jgi:hypothetical protein
MPLKVQVILTTWPNIVRVAACAVRTFLGGIRISERKFSLELCLKRGKSADEFRASLLEKRSRRDGAVGLNLDEEIGLEGMRDFVASE